MEAEKSSFLDDVYQHCRQDDECMLWLGTTDSHGLPLYNYSSKCRVHLRRFIYDMYIQSANNRRVIMRCGNRTCLNPDHMNGLMLSQFLSLISRDGSKSTISARINMQKAKQQRSKLNMDIARQIRQDERLAKEVAQEYGVSISTIRHIRRNIMYVDHQNPWSQLL